MKILMLGAPGAGKGVISQRLSERLGIPQISTGDIIREEIKKQTEIGKMAENLIHSGKLLADDLTLRLVEGRLKNDDCKRGFIFDGFPRNMPQAEEFDKISGFDIILNFVVSKKTVVERVCSRRICEKCKRIYNTITLKPKEEGVCDLCSGKLVQRKDDTEEVMIKRLEVYDKETRPLIEFYRKTGKVVDIDAEPSVEAVFCTASKIVDEHSE